MARRDFANNLAKYITIATAVTFLLLLLLLHLLKPEIDPSWRLISEYQIGDHGWLMSVAFFTLASSQASFFFAICSLVKGLAGRIGLVLILLSVAGFIIAGSFPPDPIMTPPELYSFSMWVHSIGGLPALLGMPLIVLFVSWSVLKNRSLRINGGIRYLLIIIAVGVWLSFTAWLVGSSLQRDAIESGLIEQYKWIGWPNRLFIVAYCVWLIIVVQQILVRYRNN